MVLIKSLNLKKALEEKFWKSVKKVPKRFCPLVLAL